MVTGLVLLVTSPTDSGRINNLQFCIGKNINLDYIRSQTQSESSRCISPNEGRVPAFYISGNGLIFCTPSIASPIPCMGTQDDDIIYDARITKEIFSSEGSDMLFVNAADTMMIGGMDDDISVAGPGTIS